MLHIVENNSQRPNIVAESSRHRRRFANKFRSSVANTHWSKSAVQVVTWRISAKIRLETFQTYLK